MAEDFFDILAKAGLCKDAKVLVTDSDCTSL